MSSTVPQSPCFSSCATTCNNKTMWGPVEFEGVWRLRSRTVEAALSAKFIVRVNGHTIPFELFEVAKYEAKHYRAFLTNPKARDLLFLSPTDGRELVIGHGRDSPCLIFLSGIQVTLPMSLCRQAFDDLIEFRERGPQNRRFCPDDNFFNTLAWGLPFSVIAVALIKFFA